MKLEKAIEILENYQMWRTGEYDYYQDSQSVHTAIDKVLSEVKRNIKLKDTNDIASQIKEIRVSKNYTQAFVAQQMGVTQGEYSKIENVKRKKFSVQMLNKLSEILEVPINQFAE